MLDRKAEVRSELGSVRKRTLDLLGLVPDEFLKVRVHDFYSPIGWHFGHVGRTEEYWISHKALGRPVIDDHLSFLFGDLPENPKDNRVNLPSREEIVGYLNRTRERTLRDLDESELTPGNPFLRDGYAWDFAVQHECQHQETICEMLQLIQMRRGAGAVSLARHWPEPLEDEMVDIPGGAFRMGSDEWCVYDNERDSHQVEVKPFKLSKTQITTLQWLAFIEDGGYRRPELWSAEGWTWRCEEDATAPEYWMPLGESYYFSGPLSCFELDLHSPASSLSWYEAEAYLKWKGRRFPTEIEWEYAASRSVSGVERKHPWGLEEPNGATAVFGIGPLGPQPVGSKPCGASIDGILDLAGNVWEWTSSVFAPYPGFKAFPYDGYSKDHMQGRHRVCRGGSWATSGRILRRTFRNWYVPTYRQGFIGLRCADD